MSTPAYDPFMAEVVEGDPHPLYAQLRARTPRLFLERYNAWFFFTFDDVWTLSKSRVLSVGSGITPSQLLLNAPANQFMVSQMDPPDHVLYRTALNPLFKPGAAQQLEADMRAQARALLAAIRARGGGDLLMEFAAPLAVAIGCTLSGLPRADAGLLLRWTNQFFHREMGKPGDTAVGGQAGVEMIDYIGEFLRGVREGRYPAEGAVATLLEVQRADPSITDQHILFIVLNLQIAAGDTVPKGITSTLHRLWSNPDQLALLRANPTLALAAFLEGVRIDMPTQMQGRVATETFEHDGVTIDRGQRTLFLFASANRDPAEFEQPDRYVIERSAKRTLGFGNGIHRCLGVHVAQVEGQVAVAEAMAALPRFEIDMEKSRHHKTEYVKGWSNLWVRC